MELVAQIDAVVLFHRRVDELIARSETPRPCTDCSDPVCCVQPVVVGLWEAMNIVRYAPRDLRARIEKWVATGIGAEQLDLIERDGEAGSHDRGVAMARRRVPCPLLGDDGACTVYAARPSSCRAFVPMTDHPEDCRRWLDGDLDLLFASADSIFRASGPVDIGRVGLLPDVLEIVLNALDLESGREGALR